jgi:hypothetical protein
VGLNYIRVFSLLAVLSRQIAREQRIGLICCVHKKVNHVLYVPTVRVSSTYSRCPIRSRVRHQSSAEAQL